MMLQAKYSRSVWCRFCAVCLFALLFVGDVQGEEGGGFELEIEQITSGEKHHIFGYIGQCRTIPWNGSGRYILGMEIDRLDRMPEPGDAATVFVIDTHDGNKIVRLDETRAWNPQQGTMFFWNPKADETQFFFNDRDAKTGEVFTVLYDLEKRERVREYRFKDGEGVGNGGVAWDGSFFMGLNYGRLARLRLVTGYPKANDWSRDELSPTDDGIFVVDIKTGKRRLLVSYRQMEEEMKKNGMDFNRTGMFVNHTLLNRDADCVYFFARCEWTKFPGIEKGERGNAAFTINLDGTGLTLHKQHIGGHPEWDAGRVMIGSLKEDGEQKQIRYDIDTQKVVGRLGDKKMFPKPEGDVALSPDGNWFVNGYKPKTESLVNYYSVLRRSDGAFARSEGVAKGSNSKNRDLRLDPAPRWNRTNDAILVPGMDENGKRQMFVITIEPRS